MTTPPQQPPIRRRLGRGLAALIGDDPSTEEFSPASTAAAAGSAQRGLRQVPIEHLRANPNNPRKSFKDEELDELGRSIREKGLLQPVLVRPRGDGVSFEIVAGERRWRAAQRAGVHELPVIVRELSDEETLEIAIIENVQRADLNPLEEARAYQQLMNQFGHTQLKLSEVVGKSRSHIANTLRLLSLPSIVQDLIEGGDLSAGHARALIQSDDAAALAKTIIELDLSVREAEEMARGTTLRAKEKQRHEPSPPPQPKSSDLKALEKMLTEATGLKVEISDRGRAGGHITIHYKSLDQLDDICRRLAPNS